MDKGLWCDIIKIVKGRRTTNQKNQMNIAIKFIGLLLLGVAILATMTKFMEWGMERQESYECQRWVLESSQFKDKGYYLANWQVEQCKARKIDVSNIPTE